MNRLNYWALRMIASCVAALTLGSISSEARLGETASQCATRYGMPKTDVATKSYDKAVPLLEGAMHYTYEHQGWKIRAAFLDLEGPAVRVEYKKITGGTIRDFEIEAILKAEGNWVQTAYSDPKVPNTNSAAGAITAAMLGNKMWKREDGAIARFYFNTFRLDLPIAQKYEEQFKRAKEQKARAAVPQF